MKQKIKMLKSLNNKRYRGVSLIEALVAVVVFTIGLVGISKMIGNALKSTQASEGQGNIAILVDDLFERMSMLNAAGGTSKTNEGNIAKNAFLDNSSCAMFTDDISKNRCALGQLSRQEWNSQIATLLGNDLISVNVCRKVSASSANCVANTDSTRFIFVDIKWKQKIVGKAKTGETTVTGNYVAHVSM
ncbi:MAG: hypothetical protein RLZZ210_1394 [Pseudomonadota bacterium]|jgi:type IV pilus assembly protein PilV